MADNVSAFPGLGLPLDHIEVQAELVERLEGLLEEARSGQLLALAYAGVARNEMIKTSWAGDVQRSMIGYAIAKLQHEYFSAVTEND
jgi:hypothetical protein